MTGPERRTWMHGAHPHDSARRHVTGGARFTDDVPLPPETLHAYLGLSTIARTRLERLELEAVRSAPGVVGVLTAQDIPGTNDISTSHAGDEPVLAEGEIVFWGQPLFIVVADTRDAARRAARLARVDGKSPVEYVTAEADRERVRLAARPLILEPPASVTAVRDAWAERLRQAA